MNRFLPIILTAALFFAVATLYAAPHPAPAKKQGFEALPLVATRNIFDPDRQSGAMVPPPTVQIAPANNEFAALTGTLLCDGKTLAFFSGSRPEWNKVLGLQAEIAGAVITGITAGGIEVERAGRRVAVAVGQTVPLDATSAPAAAPVSDMAIPTAAPASPTSSTPASPAPGAAPVSAPSATDREALMRRMMEKRQKELQ